MVVEETPVGSRWRGVGEMPAGGPRAGRGSALWLKLTITGGC